MRAAASHLWLAVCQMPLEEAVRNVAEFVPEVVREERNHRV